jgi:hypothetical protein
MINSSATIDLVCDEDYLKNYIASSGRPFILLIDELNSLGYSLQNKAAVLLRRMFLDPADRYLVFSTHLYLTVDSTVDTLGKYFKTPSPRKLVLVDMPESFNMTELRSISQVCKHLTVEEAQFYGGIPSLIYCSKLKINDFSPEVRFLDFVEGTNLGINMQPKEFVDSILYCFFTGIFYLEPSGVKQLCSFASTAAYGEKIKARWPLVYLSLIIEHLVQFCSRNSETESLKFDALSDITDLFEEFKRDMLIVGSGMGWKTLIHATILMRCMKAYTGGSTLKLFEKKIGAVTSVTMDRMPDVQLLEEAKDVIFETMGSLKEGSLVMFYPQYASFKLVESFLAFKTSTGKVNVYGIQVKTGRASPNTNVVIPEWVNNVILIRGDAPKTCENRDNKWIYMSKSQIEDLLGHSLKPLYPANWKED